MNDLAHRQLVAMLRLRFGEDLDADTLDTDAAGRLLQLAGHRVHRHFTDEPVDPALLRLVCACALSAPSKSDLQQRDIIIVQDPDVRRKIGALMPHAPWVAAAPAMAVFCLNGRRLSRIAEWRGKPFPNDHFDLLFNATGDAAIALGWFQVALAMAGLGGCPISEVRNHAAPLSEWLGLPDKVAPFAAFCIGWPKRPGAITPRLPLSVNLHLDRFAEDQARSAIDGYDRRRETVQPYRSQRLPDIWGTSPDYGWSEDKARQYSKPLRQLFGAFLRNRKFNMD